MWPQGNGTGTFPFVFDHHSRNKSIKKLNLFKRNGNRLNEKGHKRKRFGSGVESAERFIGRQRWVEFLREESVRLG
jgi:hypothetical protein